MIPYNSLMQRLNWRHCLPRLPIRWASEIRLKQEEVILDLVRRSDVFISLPTEAVSPFATVCCQQLMRCVACLAFPLYIIMVSHLVTPARNMSICAVTSRNGCFPTLHEYLAKVTRCPSLPPTPKTGISGAWNYQRPTGPKHPAISCYWFYCIVFAQDQFSQYQHHSNEPLQHHSVFCGRLHQAHNLNPLIGKTWYQILVK